MRPRKKFLLQLFVSIALITVLLRIVNPGKVLSLLKGIDLRIFLLLFLVVTLDRCFMAFKWYLLLKARGLDLSIPDAIRVYYIGTFASFFLPTTVGGDLVRIYKLHAEKKEGTKIFSSVIIERMAGFIASAVVAVFGVSLLIYFLKVDVWWFFWLTLILLVSFCIIFILSFSIHFFFRGKVKSSLKKIFFVDKLIKLYNVYQEYKNQKKLLIVFVLLSCLEQLVPVIGNYLASLALGLSIPFLYFLAVIPIVHLFNRIPLSFNGIGVTEGLLVYFFSLLHLGAEDAFSIGLVGHAAVLLGVLPVVFYLSGKHFFRVSLKKTKKPK